MVAIIPESRYCAAMVTSFAQNQVLIQLDILSKLIWACKAVRITLRKQKGA